MRARYIVLLCVVIGCVIVGLALLVEERKYAHATAKYPIGTTIEEAQAKIARPYPVEEATLLFPPGRPNEEDKTTTPFYTIKVEDDRIILDFNFYRRLIRTWRMSSPVERWWRKRQEDRPEAINGPPTRLSARG